MFNTIHSPTVGPVVHHIRPQNHHRSIVYINFTMVEVAPPVPSTLPKLSTGEFKALNKMAVHMNHFVGYYSIHFVASTADGTTTA